LLGATLHHEGRHLLAESELRLAATGPFDPERAGDGTSAEIAWQAARLPDINALQHYLEPFLADPAPLLLLGGSALSDGQLVVAENGLRGSLPLSGQNLRTRLREHTVENDIRLTLALNQAALDGTRLDISGSRLRWQAQGEVNLRASGVQLALLDQHLRGDLHLALRLAEGDLASRQFNAARSFLHLDQVQRQNGGPPRDAGWWVQLDFDDAQLRWTEQIRLASRVALTMRDTGLLARLFLARARDSAWLGRLLYVRGIEGSAQLDLNDTRIRLSDVDLRGENLTLLADLALAQGTSNGALYARLGALGLGVELNDSEPTLRIVRPRRWFDAWRAAQNSAR
jgi:hypothetical protein